MSAFKLGLPALVVGAVYTYLVLTARSHETCAPTEGFTDFASSSVAAQCIGLFEATKTDSQVALQSAPMTLAQRRELGFRNQYHWERVVEERVSAIESGRYTAFVKSQLPLTNELGTQVAIVAGIRERSAPAGMKASAPRGISSFEDLAFRAVDFGIETYRVRRPHWTDAFLEKLKKIAKEYLAQSTYIVIEEGTGYRDKKIRSTIRLIKEKDGFIPMERYLGIEVDVGDKLKVEPGNFAVDKKFSQIAWPEVIMHLLSKAARSLEPGRENHYLTYADQYSVLLYSQLGFTPIDPARYKMRPGVVMKDGKILVDGVWWTPMEASQEKLDQLLDIHVERLADRGHDPEEAKTLLARQKEIEQPKNLSHREIVGSGLWNGKPVAGRLEIAREGQENERRRLLLRLDGASSPFIVANIENFAPPLKGRILSSRESEKIEYVDGKLRIHRQGSGYQTSIEIEASPDLGVVKSIQIRHASDLVQTQIDLEF